MATPSRTQVLNDKIVSTVDTYIRKTPADVIFNRSLLLNLLWNSAKEPGVAGPELNKLGGNIGNRVKRFGGREAWIPVANQRSTSVTSFRGTDLVSTPIDPVMTTQRAGFAYYTSYAGIDWQTWIENQGPEAVIDLWQAKLDMNWRTMSETLETDLWGTAGDPSDTQPKLPGIQAYVSSSPSSGTVWNIDRATYSWQSNQATTSVGSFATNGLDKLRTMWTTMSGTNGCDPPDLLITTAAVWGYLVKAMEGIHRVVGMPDQVDPTFSNPRYMGRPVYFTTLCPSGYLYILNLKYWDLCLKQGADFEVFDLPMTNDQVIMYQKRIVWGGTYGCERFDRQAVLTGITA